MGASARARRHRWRALVIAALPCALLVTTTANAAPPPTEPTAGSLVVAPSASASPSAPTPPSTSPSSEPPATEPPATEPPATEAPATAAPSGDLTLAQTLTPTEQIAGSKAPTSRLAETDPTLLGRTDATPVRVMVKLDYDSIATYGGTIDGLAPTSPQITGTPLNRTSSAEKSYDRYIGDQEAVFVSALHAAVPDARIGRSLRTVYGGMSLSIPANKVADVLAIPNVVAVQSDKLEQPLTDSSGAFIGATSLYPALGGTPNAGKGIIVGVLDTGIWPEHPSFKDNGNLPAPPPPLAGGKRDCNLGDNPVTPATDPFVCNNKLIGAQVFLDGYLSDPNVPDEVYPDSARDSNGHGTHTTSTAAGDAVASAQVFGVERGPIAGIAPGAYVEMFKVCGLLGCADSDTAAAVEHAIHDGVNVINFSIGGGTNPATDPTELAFLDAYGAGVFVAASAGNSGPGASTTEHLGPWVTTVAASTQDREFVSTLTLTGADGATKTLTGASIMGGVATPTPVVLASAPPYNDLLCGKPAAPGTFTGKIVVCQRGGEFGRAEKGFNVKQGGAAGMILYNPTLADVETDNHWLPAIHLAVGTDLLAFLSAHPGVTATFTPGAKVLNPAAGDIMANFSSRGPGGLFIKPDVTAPGVQILAGNTPTPDEVAGGPPGQLYQAIAGTSMSSPHVAGAAALLKALHRDWTPGQIKSALMTTGVQQVLKEDAATPADPFDFGSGRIDLTKAGGPGLTFDATAEDMIHFANDPATAANLNVPSLDIPTMPGRLETTRTAKNVSGKKGTWDVEVTAPNGSAIEVKPKKLALGKNATGALNITVTTTLTDPVQQFGEIRLVPRTSGLPTLHIPVAFVPQQGDVTLTQDCAPTTITRGANTFCTVTAHNNRFSDATVDITTETNRQLTVTGVQGEGASVTHGIAAALGRHLAGAQLGVPAIGPGENAGYIPLELFGAAPMAIGDEDILNFNVPAFVYAGETYDRIGVDSNGYLVAGGGAAQDNECCENVTIPSPISPNNMLAPFWTDLDGKGAEGIRATVLTDGVNDWIVVEWKVNLFGTTSARTFQVWLGVNADDEVTSSDEDITFAYDPTALPATPGRQPFAVGAENAAGAGASIGEGVLPTEDLRVVSTDPVPGASYSYQVTAQGARVGEGVVTSELSSSVLPGTTVVTDNVIVQRP